MNQGKGAALKTGFSYILKNTKNCLGVVTADADGQHLKKDILAIADCLKPEQRELTIGSRTFDSDVPLRSHFGNKLTRIIMKFVFKIDLKDTFDLIEKILIKINSKKIKFLKIKENLISKLELLDDY